MKDRPRRHLLVVLAGIAFALSAQASYAATPTIGSVSPDTAPNTGKRQVTISGESLGGVVYAALEKQGQAHIVDPHPFDAQSDTTLTVTFDLTDAGPGTWDVVVRDPAGVTGTCSDCFLVEAAAPKISGEYHLGQGAANREVTINGSNIFRGASVSISGAGVTIHSTTWEDNKNVTVKASVSRRAATGTRTVTVTNTDGAAATCTCLEIRVAPSVEKADPPSGSQGAQDLPITLTGTGFDGSPPEGLRVSFSGNGVTGQIRSDGANSDTKLEALVDIASNAPTGPRHVTVINPDGGSGTCAECFSVAAKARVVAAVPPVALNAGERDITIIGTGFTSNFPGDRGAIKLTKPGHLAIEGEDPGFATDLGSAIDKAVSATFDLHDAAPGVWSVVLVNGDGSGPSTCSDCLLIAGEPPTLDEPAANPASRGAGATSTRIAITGDNFWPGATVEFAQLAAGGTNGITVESVARESRSRLLADITVSSSATPGPRLITVRNEDGTFATCGVRPTCFTITPAPKVTSVSPNSRTNDDTHVLTINGADFDDSGTAVLRSPSGSDDDPIVSSSYSRLSATQVKATFDLEDAKPGAWDVLVTNGDGGGPAVCGGCLTIAGAPPTITSISPTELENRSGGQAIVISGSGLKGAVAELSKTGETAISGTNKPSDDGEKLIATLDLSNIATGPWDVTAKTAFGTATCGGCLTVKAAAPVVTSITPSSRARGAEGQVLTVKGNHFISGAQVIFSNPLIKTNSTKREDFQTIKVNVSIAETREASGPASVDVLNPDGKKGTCEGCFEVTDPGTVALAYGSNKPLAGPLLTASFSSDAGPVSASNFVLENENGRAVKGSVTCRDDAGASSPCTGSEVRSATFSPASVLVPGQSYTATVNPKGARSVLSGGAPVTTNDLDFVAGSPIQQESSPAVTPLWDEVSSDKAHGGWYRRARLGGQTASTKIVGKKVTLYTVKGPDQGIMYMYVGSTRCRFDLYSPKRVYKVERECASPRSGRRTFQVKPTGTKNPASSNTFVSVDAIRVDDGALERTPRLRYTWQPRANTDASGDRYIRERVAGAEVRFSFKGERFEWRTLVGPRMGRASVYMDDELVKTVDLYARERDFVELDFGCEAPCDRVHSVRIVIERTKNPASSGRYVYFDRFKIG